uniref:Uncharacterized protein n=1 Tax=Clastoptera arizonana TaxID=38151 RepID=A0A1B6C192_9HEMI
MKNNIIKTFVITFLIIKCSASISQEIFLLDNTLVYQIANTDATLVDINHLIGNLISYKVHLSKLVSQYIIDKSDIEQSMHQILELKVPSFLRYGFNLNKLKTAYQLTDQQVQDIEIEIGRIWMNWDQFNKLINSSKKVTKNSLPFFLIDIAGTNLAKIFDNGTHDHVHDMLIEFSTYYYFLGKIIKMVIKGDEDCISMAKPLYEGEKPEFLKKFVHTNSLRYTLHLTYTESKSVQRWIKRISARWFTFLNMYQKKLGIADVPNLGNLNMLKESDNKIATRIKENTKYQFDDFIQDLKMFLEYLCLILRRNYKHRQEVLTEARKFYEDQSPLFLREISDPDSFKLLLNINNLQLFTVRHFLNQIYNKWPFLVGTKEEHTFRPSVTTLPQVV